MNQIEFWRTVGKGNLPEDYWNHIKRSEFLYEFIKDEIHKSNYILELGCNGGRNIKYLLDKGYWIQGIDCSPNAVRFAQEKGLPVWQSSIEDYLLEGKPEVLLCMAVLEHLPKESEWVFEKMTKARYIICIEDEITDSARHFPRKYKEIFEGLGMKEIKHQTDNGGTFHAKFEARLFQN